MQAYRNFIYIYTHIIEASSKMNDEQLTTSNKHRRVSISDPGLDNPGFEHQRRISVTSSQEPERKRSILHPSRPGSVENLHKFDMENGGKHPHSLVRKKSAYSLSSSIRDKVEYTDELERSVPLSLSLSLTHFSFFSYIHTRNIARKSCY